MTLNDQEAQKLVSTAARRYARACWWADQDDLMQEGHAAIASARKDYDPSVGVAPEQYFWRAVVFAMKRALWSMSTPVTGGSHRPRESYAGLTRTALDGFDAPTASPPADVALDDARWRKRVRDRLLRLSWSVLEDGRTHRVLLGEATPERMAEARREKVGVVYGRAAKLRSAAVADSELYSLMQERCKER